MLVPQEQESAIKSWQIFRALSDSETRRMLLEIASDKDDWHKNCMGMTRRAYYKRLRLLKTYKLIQKIHNTYRLTTFGTMIMSEMEVIENIISHIYNISYIDTIKRNVEITRQQKEELLEKFIDGELLKRFQEILLS